MPVDYVATGCAGKRANPWGIHPDSNNEEELLGGAEPVRPGVRLVDLFVRRIYTAGSPCIFVWRSRDEEPTTPPRLLVFFQQFLSLANVGIQRNVQKCVIVAQRGIITKQRIFITRFVA